jgi:hypothetical protein
MAVAIRATRGRGVVDVEATQAVDADAGVELLNERIQLRRIGDVDTRDVGVAGVDAETEPRVIDRVDDAGQLDRIAPDRAAGTRGVLQQEPAGRSDDARPRPLCEPTWSTIPSAAIALATSMVLRSAVRLLTSSSGSSVARLMK